MLEKANIPISFAQGLDTKSDPKQVVPGKLLELENGVFYQSRSIKKRDGFDDLPTDVIGGGSVSDATAITVLGRTLVEYSKAGVQSYSPEIDAWATQGGLAKNVSFTTSTVAQNGTSQANSDAVHDPASGLTCVIWMENDNWGASDFFTLKYSIIDQASGAKIVSDAVVVTSAGPDRMGYQKVLFDSGFFYIIYHVPGLTRLDYRRISTSTPTVLSANVLIASDARSTEQSSFDASVINSSIYVAYTTTSTEPKILNVVAGVPGASTTITGEDSRRCIAVWGDSSNNVWVSFSDGTDVKIVAYNAALSSAVLSLRTVVAGVLSAVKVTGIFQPGSSPLTSTVYIEKYVANSGQNPTCTLYRYAVNSSFTRGGIVSSGLGICSKPYIYDSSEYIVCAYRSTIQPIMFLMSCIVTTADFTNYELLVAAAKIAPQTAYVFSNASGTEGKPGYIDISCCQELTAIGSSSDLLFSYGEITQATFLSGGTTPGFPVAGVKTASFDLDTESFLELTAAGQSHVFGGLLSAYDGESLSEHGFNIYPDAIVAASVSGGGSINPGTRSWVYVYRWIDVNGNIVRSAPSVPLSFTNANSTVNITLYNYRVTQKTEVFIDIYRTADLGTVYYLVDSVNNDKTTATQIYADQLSDSNLIVRPQLYTTGGEVENIAPPAPATFGTYKNRMIVVPAETPSSFWYSKEVVPSYPVEFSDLFIQSIDQKGGGITAVTQMDDKLCLFKKSSIFVVTGDGPAPSGANNDFTPAQEIASDSGCINDRSIVLMPMGVMYQSEKGIYLLSRNLQVNYIGADVEAYNSNVITAAKLYPKRNQVIFTLDSGVALVYDYAFQQWSVFTGIEAVGVTVYDDKIAYAKADGTVMLETPGVFLDDNVGYSLKLKTSWLSFAGLQGFQRVRQVMLLGEYKSDHTIQIDVAHDFIDTPTQTVEIVPDAIPPYQYQLDFNRQKCESLQLTIQDIDPAGEGFEISSMAFEVGVKKGLNKLGQTRTNG